MINTLSQSAGPVSAIGAEFDVRLALFRVEADQFQVLLWQYEMGYALARQLAAKTGEDLDQLAYSLISQLDTGDCYLEQLYSYGHLGDHASSGLTISYFGLLSSELPIATSHSAAVWCDVSGLPEVSPLDRKIIELAQQRIAAKLEYSTLAFRLLNEEFTLSELQQIFQVVQRRQLDKRNFRKRMLSLGCVEQIGELRKTGSHRPAQLYRETNPEQLQFFS